MEQSWLGSAFKPAWICFSTERRPAFTHKRAYHRLARPQLSWQPTRYHGLLASTTSTSMIHQLGLLGTNIPPFVSASNITPLFGQTYPSGFIQTNVHVLGFPSIVMTTVVIIAKQSFFVCSAVWPYCASFTLV